MAPVLTKTIRLFLIIVALFLFIIPSAFAIFSDKDDWIDTKDGLVDYTPQCLFDQGQGACIQTYHLRNPNLLLSRDIGKGKAITVIMKDRANNELLDLPYILEEMYIETYHEPIIQKVVTIKKGKILGNGTGEETRTVERKQNGTITKTRKAYKPLRTNLKSGEEINLTVRYDLKPGQSFDIIIEVNTGFQKWRWNNWAWFDSSWDGKIPFNLTNLTMATQFNSTIWVVNNGSIDTTAWCLSSNCSSLIFTNGTEDVQIDRAFGSVHNARRTNSTLYVCVDTVNVTGNDAYAYYDNPGAPQKDNTLSSCSDYIGYWPGDGDGRDLILGQDNFSLGANSLYTNDGKFGQGWHLDGDDGAGLPTVTDSARLDAPSVTVTAWVKREATGLEAIASRNLNTPAWNFYIHATLHQLRATYYNGAERDYGNNGTALSVMGRWYHVAFTYNATDARSKLFVDGLRTTTNQAGSGGIQASDSDIQMGCWGAGCGSARYNGEIDNFKMRARALSEAEILAEFKEGESVYFNVSGTASTFSQPPTTPYLSGVDLIPSNASTVFANDSVFFNATSNATDYRNSDMTTNYVFSRNNVINWSTFSSVLVSGGGNTTATVLYAGFRQRYDNITVWVNSSNTSGSYAPPINSTITIANSLPTIPSVQLPANGTTVLGLNQTIVCNGSVDYDESVNYTFWVDNQNPIRFDSGPAQNSSATVLDFQGMNSTTYWWTCLATDGVGGNSGLAANYSFTANNTLVNTTTGDTLVLEGDSASYSMTLIHPPGNVSAVAWLEWNGTSYGSGTRTNISAHESQFNLTITIPQLDFSDNNVTWTWFYNVTNLGYTNYNTSGVARASYLQVAQCDITSFTKKIINFTFADETTLAKLNATVDSSTWSYGNAGRTLSFNNATRNLEYDFCMFPNWTSSVVVTHDIQYAETGYPQRTTNYDNVTYTNSTPTNYTLYLLATADGIYSSYQVVNTGNQVIQGASVTASRTIDGVITQVANGVTDSSGLVTFWLNPNYAHTIVTSATGYLTQTNTITPTQTLYTITMQGTTATSITYSNLLEGVIYYTHPPSGIIEAGEYNFTFQLTRGVNPIDNCTMIVKYVNDTQAFNETGCTTAGGSLSRNFTVVAGSPLLLGSFQVGLNNTITYIEQDARWFELTLANDSNAFFNSLRYGLNESIFLPEWGTDSKTTDFSRIVFFFLMMAVIMAALNVFSGYDSISPGSALYIVTGFVIFMSHINGVTGQGYFYLNGAVNLQYFNGAVADIVNNWLVAIHLTLISAAMAFNNSRRTEG